MLCVPTKRQWCLAGAFSQCRQSEEMLDSAFSSMRQWSGLSGWGRLLFSMPAWQSSWSVWLLPTGLASFGQSEWSFSALQAGGNVSVLRQRREWRFSEDVLNDSWRINNKFIKLQILMSVDSHVSQPSEQSAGCLLVKIFCRRLDNDFYSEIDQSPLCIYQLKYIQ